MIDMHCHIIPGIDDGSRSIGVSESMLRIASAQGTKTIIATPHYYKGYYENNYEDVKNQTASLNQFAKELNIDIEILPGQEILLDKYTLQGYKEGILSGLNGTKYMLAEFSMDKMPKDSLDILYELRLLGVKIIIAHPERYVFIIESPKLINSFIEEGCLFQLNSGSITGIFGKKVKETSQLLLGHGVYSFIASDAHSDGGRNPGLKDAFYMASQIDIGIEERVQVNCQAMLKNLDIKKDFEKLPDKKSIFEFFKKKNK
ncbi:MAG TPA: CpsB/CapC family capsule biosynthesis tyrosine phosphatase [Clostridiaceae bacterium]